MNDGYEQDQKLTQEHAMLLVEMGRENRLFTGDFIALSKRCGRYEPVSLRTATVWQARV